MNSIKKGLGRGLSSLIGESKVVSSTNKLSLSDIVPNPYQPRKTIDPESIKELAASIESEGLLQPVVVRRIHDDYQLIAGERRWRAHQFLKRDKILARKYKYKKLIGFYFDKYLLLQIR